MLRILCCWLENSAYIVPEVTLDSLLVLVRWDYISLDCLLSSAKVLRNSPLFRQIFKKQLISKPKRKKLSLTRSLTLFEENSVETGPRKSYENHLRTEDFDSFKTYVDSLSELLLSAEQCPALKPTRTEELQGEALTLQLQIQRAREQSLSPMTENSVSFTTIPCNKTLKSLSKPRQTQRLLTELTAKINSRNRH